MKGAKELADRMRRAEQHGFAPSAGDMALLVRELDRLAAIDGAGLGEAGEIKARFDSGTAGDNILQAVHDIKALLAIVGQQAADLAAANASILKLRAEVEEQRGRAEDAERHCSELTTARNKQDEARALACYQRDEALAELAKLKGQQP